MDIGVAVIYTILFLIPLGIASVMVFKGIKELIKWRAIKDAPTMAIKDIRGGFVETVGKVRPMPGSDLRTPFSGTPCVLYEATIKEYTGKKGRWKTRYIRKEGPKFIVEDDAWGVLVDPAGAEMDLDVGYCYTNKGLEPSEEASDILTGVSLPIKGVFGFLYRNYKMEESYVLPGKEVYVLGSARKNNVRDDLAGDIILSPYTIKKDGTFIISTKGEKGAAASRLMSGICLLTIGVVFALGFLMVLLTLIDIL